MQSKYRFVNEERNYLKLTSVLIEHGLRINRPNKEGKTVLHKEVIKKRSTKVLSFLIAAGANVDIADSNGRTILFDAIFLMA